MIDLVEKDKMNKAPDSRIDESKSEINMVAQPGIRTAASVD